MKHTFLIAIMLLSTSIIFAQGKTESEPDQTSKQSSIIFKSTVYDFGTIAYGEEAKGIFEFKNVSKKAITLTNVKASCGCTGTDWPREEIKKRKKGEIAVTYDTKRVGNFHKNVYVYVDGNTNPIQLEIKGEVLPGDGSVKNQEPIQKKIIDNSPKHIQVDGNKKVTESDGTEKNTTKSVEPEKSYIKQSTPKQQSVKSVEKQSYIKKSNSEQRIEEKVKQE